MSMITFSASHLPRFVYIRYLPLRDTADTWVHRQHIHTLRPDQSMPPYCLLRCGKSYSLHLFLIEKIFGF